MSEVSITGSDQWLFSFNITKRIEEQLRGPWGRGRWPSCLVGDDAEWADVSSHPWRRLTQWVCSLSPAPPSGAHSPKSIRLHAPPNFQIRAQNAPFLFDSFWLLSL